MTAPTCNTCAWFYDRQGRGLSKCRHPLRKTSVAIFERAEKGLCGEAGNNHVLSRIPSRADLIAAEAQAVRDAQGGQS